MKEIICRDGERVLVDKKFFYELKKYNWYVGKCKGIFANTKLKGKHKRFSLSKLVFLNLDIENYFTTKIKSTHYKDGNYLNCTLDNIEIELIKKPKIIYDKNHCILLTPCGEKIKIDSDIGSAFKDMNIRFNK